MKKILCIKYVVTLLMIVLAFAVHVVAESITYTATYDYSNLTIGNDTLAGETYALVSYEGLHNDGTPGAPSLPIDYIRFSVPYNASNFTVSTMTISSGTTDIGLAPYPCQAPVPINSDEGYTITLPDSIIYDSGEYYPSLTENAWIVDEGFLAGENHIVTVAVMPISYRYRAVRNLLRKSRQVNITLSYDLSTSTQLSHILTANSQARIEGQQLTQNLVVNPNSVSAFAPPQSLTNLLNNNSIYSGPTVTSGHPSIPYLIITTPELSYSLRRIVALKRQKGYNVKVATVDEIMSDPYAQYGDVVDVNGVPTVTYNDNVGVIRQYLKLAYHYSSTKYLLLAGTDVPYRKKWSFGDSVPTDLYYSDLTGNWANGIDKYPELFVGRILAKNINQINNYTDKLFRYELNPGRGDYSYLKRIFYTEAIDFEKYNEWDYVNSSYEKVFPYYTLFREIINSQFPSGTDVVNEINTTNYGYLSIMNHGSPPGFITYGRRAYSSSEKPYNYLWAIDSVHLVYYNRMDTADTHIGNAINNLSNKWYPSICYSIGCEPTPYDVVKGYKVETNFGESFTTGKDYGGPAFLGNTRNGYLGKQSTGVEKLFAEQLANKKYKIGIAEALSRSLYSGSNYFSLVHNLIGDPEFEIWTDIPQRYSNIMINRTNNCILISGIDADSTIVAYYSNDGEVGTETISTSSVTLNGISPNSTIMLYKHNHIPYIAPLSLQNTTLNHSQYVIASDVTAGNSIDDNRTSGDVTVPDGVEYEIEASGKVTLEDGFKVDKGATFAVYPSSF